MADPIGIQITNAAQIKAAYDKAPALMTKALNIAIKQGVLFIKRGSMINSPVDTGRMRASHGAEWGNLEGSVFTETSYAAFVHEGTKFMAGRPFMADAVAQSQSDVDEFFTDAVQGVLNDIGRQSS